MSTTILMPRRREYAKVVMIREISKRGIITCFKNPDFYRFATWNDFKNIVEDLHPNGLAALAAGAGEDEESLMHKPNLPLQVSRRGRGVYRGLLSERTSTEKETEERLMFLRERDYVPDVPRRERQMQCP